MALDLAGAFPDALDARVAPDALQRQVVHQPHAAVDLDRLVGDEGQHLGGLQLGHRHVLVGDRALVVFPGGLHDQQVGGLQLGRHVGELERDALELADLLAELLALRGIFDGVAERAFGAAEAGRRDLQPRRAEPGVGDLETLVHLAQHLAGRQPAIVEFEDRIGVAAMRDVAVAVADG